MFTLTEEQLNLKHKIDSLHIQKTAIEKDIKQLQRECDHVFLPYENSIRSEQLKYCFICGFEDYN
jgi:hypothetical protein